MFGSLYSNFNYKNLKLNSKKSVIERQVRDRERTVQKEKNKIDSFHEQSAPSFHMDMPDTAYAYAQDFGELLTMSDSSFNDFISQEQHKNLLDLGNNLSLNSIANISLLKQLEEMKKYDLDASVLSESEVNELFLQEQHKNLFDFGNNISSVTNIEFLKQLDGLKKYEVDSYLSQLSDSQVNELVLKEQHKNLFTFDNQISISQGLLENLKQFSDLPQNNDHLDSFLNGLTDSQVQAFISEEKHKNLFGFENMGAQATTFHMKSLEELKHDEKILAHGSTMDSSSLSEDAMSKMASKNLLGVGFDFEAGAAAIVNNAMYDNLLQIHKKTTEIPVGLGGMGDGGCNVTIDDVYKKNIRVIYNVYQPKYKDNINVTGFGDFIRGCYFLLQFCEKYDLQMKFIINHPIALFLQQYVHKNIASSNTNIKFFVNNNWSGYFYDSQNYIHSIPGKTEDILCSFMSYLVNDVGVFGNGSVFVYSIGYPFVNEISEQHKKIMKQLLEPNDMMKNIVSSELSNLGLVSHQYITIHIRSGDTQLNGGGGGSGGGTGGGGGIDMSYFEKIVNEIYAVLLKHPGPMNILLISDSVLLKQMLKKKYPMLKMLLRNITHLGEGAVLDRIKIQNTLSDFYLLSFSKAIYSFSCYEHGTGFSQWCAYTYNIPYFCKYII